MQLLQSWKESLAIFAPKNFKLFFLVTLKAILDTFSSLVRYCWAPILLFFVFAFFYAQKMQALTTLAAVSGPNALLAFRGVLLSWNLFFLFFMSLLFMLIFLAARPSVLRKGYWYFVSYWYYLVYVILFLPMLVVLISGPLSLVSLSPVGALFLQGVAGFLQIILASFFILFLLDSDGSPKAAFLSLWRAIKMLIYNIPGAITALFLPLVVLTCVMLIGLALGSLFNIAEHSGLRVVLIQLSVLVGDVVMVCFMTNFYIKRLHDQSGLYFETKELE